VKKCRGRFLTKSSIDLVGEQDGTYSFVTSENERFTLELKKPEVFELDNFKGTVHFAAAYKTDIESVEITELNSWTDFESQTIKYFSGTGTYTIRLSAPADFVSEAETLVLCLGDIGSTTQVKLNGRHLSYVYRPD